LMVAGLPVVPDGSGLSPVGAVGAHVIVASHDHRGWRR
jgi:hypothetical protein